MPKIVALGRSAELASLGAGLRDKAILFAIGCISQTARRAVVSSAHATLAALAANGEQLNFRIMLAGREFPITIRRDMGDYQSLYECLGRMYPLPEGDVRFVFDGGGNIGMFSLNAAAKLQL